MIEPECVAKILRELQSVFRISVQDAQCIVLDCWNLDGELRQTQTAEELKQTCFGYAQRLENS